ncbi:hypothetical protein BDR26DRAFT_28959 [Obelidium mucronatum]|nr:hypothetical protein BDR26DRAFT_28959 [Obelidium mucronatum]
MDLSLSSDAKLLTSMTPADALKNFKRRGFFDKTRKLMAEKFTEEEEEQEIDSEKARLKQDIEKVLRHEWRILLAQRGDRIWNDRASIAKELNSAIERTVLTDLSRPLRAFLVSNTDTIKENVYESLAAILNEERKKREAALLLAEEATKRTQEKEGNDDESGGKESVGEKEKQQRNEKKLDSHDLNAKSNSSSTKMDVDSVVVPVIQSKETLPSPATVEMTHQPPVVEQPNVRAADKISEISVDKTTSEAPNTNNDSSLPSLSLSTTKLSTSNDGSVTSSDMASSSAQQQLQRQQQPLQQQQSKKRESARASSRLKGVIRNTSPTDESSTNNNDSSNSNQVETTLEIAEIESNSRDAAALTVVEAMDSVAENIATGRGDAEGHQAGKKEGK